MTVLYSNVQRGIINQLQSILSTGVYPLRKDGREMKSDFIGLSLGWWEIAGEIIEKVFTRKRKATLTQEEIVYLKKWIASRQSASLERVDGV